MQPTRHPGLGPSTTTTHHTSIGGGEKTTTSSGSVPKTSQNTRGIKLGGWSIQVTSGNIGSSAEMDALSDLLGIPPPEMAFPHNSLVLSHPQSGFHLCFDAVRALQSVYGVKAENKLEGVDCDRSDKPRRATKMGDKPTARGKAAIKVAYADEWGKKRNEAQAQQNSNEYTDNTDPSPAAAATSSSSSSSNFGPDVAMAAAASGIASAKEYDWTYSSTWAGALGQTAPPRLLPNDGTEEAQDTLATTTSSNEQSWFAPGTDPAQDRIPVERLGPSSGEPILFYDDIVLYEDELADNGSSMVNVKVVSLPLHPIRPGSQANHQFLFSFQKRVMPSGFLVLQRFFLRVDDVLFRVFDTRLYCEFTQDTAPSSTPATGAGGPDLSTLSLGATRAATKRQATAQDEQQASKWPRLIRECSGSEATYAEVKAVSVSRPFDLPRYGTKADSWLMGNSVCRRTSRTTSRPSRTRTGSPTRCRQSLAVGTRHRLHLSPPAVHHTCPQPRISTHLPRYPTSLRRE